MQFSKLDKKYVITLILLFLMLILILNIFINIRTIDIIQFSKNNSIVFNYNGNEYFEICDANVDKFSNSLYEKYQDYLSSNKDNTSNIILKKYIVMGDIYSYIFPKNIKVIYDGEIPTIIENNDNSSECYLISSN